MSLLGAVHGSVVHGRRVRVLAGHVARLLPSGAHVLDIGGGDGRIASEVMRLRPDVRVTMVDVLPRPGALLPVIAFDGVHLPLADGSVDAAMLVDVLHHADEPLALLREAARVARRCVVVKDHLADQPLARARLRLMDWVGNARYGVNLPYGYWTEGEWREAFASSGLEVDARETRLGLYPPPASLVFEDGLHFVARLRHASE